MFVSGERSKVGFETAVAAVAEFSSKESLMTSRRWPTAFLVILVSMTILWGSPKPAFAQIGAYFRVLTVGNETKYYGAINPVYQPWAALPPFTTASVSSQDGLFRAETQAGRWVYPENEPYFPSFAALATAMQQPYTIALDTGLPTERNYQMGFEPGGLATLNPQLPRITAPLHGAVDVSLTPYISIQTPPRNFFRTILRDGSVILMNETFSLGTYPYGPLSPGKEYTLDVYSPTEFLRTTLNIRFTTPIDENGDSLPNWYSPSWLQVESIARFYTIPEPGTLALAAAAVTMLGLHAARTQRNSVAGRPSQLA